MLKFSLQYQYLVKQVAKRQDYIKLSAHALLPDLEIELTVLYMTIFVIYKLDYFIQDKKKKHIELGDNFL